MEEEYLESIDTESGDSGELPQQFKTLSILSHIGNGLWALIFIITLLAMATSGQAMLRQVPELRQFGPEIVQILIIACVVMLLIIGFTIYGVILMGKGKKSGFILYAVVNGIWSLLLLLGMSPLGIITGLAGIGFIIGFSKYAKQMK